MAADKTQIAPDPNDDPASFHKPADLARVHAVTNQLKTAICILGGLAANDTKPGTKIFQRRSIRASCAELLDSNNEAV